MYRRVMLWRLRKADNVNSVVVVNIAGGTVTVIVEVVVGSKKVMVTVKKFENSKETF